MYSKGELDTPVVTEMTNLFTPSNSSKAAETSSVQSMYRSADFTPLHSDEFFTNSTLLGTKSISLLSTLAETQDFDESYAASKHQTFLSAELATRPLLSSNFNNFFTSSVKTFNNFTTSHLDFNTAVPATTTTLFKLPLINHESTVLTPTLALLVLNPQTEVNQNLFTSFKTLLSIKSYDYMYDSLRDYKLIPALTTVQEANYLNSLSTNLYSHFTLSKTRHITNLFKPTSSNHLNVRASVKDSIVNYNAFQKVFRSRFDESRSHSN